MDNKERSMQDVMNSIYLKYKLNFYKNLYRNNRQPDSLTVMEKFCAEAIYALQGPTIYALQGPTINELANFIRVSQPNAAYKVNNLVEKGHVEKVRSQKDRRQVHLFVTDKFKKYYQVNYDFVEDVQKCLEDKVPEEKMQIFKEVLEVLDDGIVEAVTEEIDEAYRNSDAKL